MRNCTPGNSRPTFCSSKCWMARSVVPCRPTRWPAPSFTSTEITAVSPRICARTVPSLPIDDNSVVTQPSAASAGANAAGSRAQARMRTLSTPAEPAARMWAKSSLCSTPDAGTPSWPAAASSAALRLLPSATMWFSGIDMDVSGGDRGN